MEIEERSTAFKKRGKGRDGKSSITVAPIREKGKVKGKAILHSINGRD